MLHAQTPAPAPFFIDWDRSRACTHIHLYKCGVRYTHKTAPALASCCARLTIMSCYTPRLSSAPTLGSLPTRDFLLRGSLFRRLLAHIPHDGNIHRPPRLSSPPLGYPWGEREREGNKMQNKHEKKSTTRTVRRDKEGCTHESVCISIAQLVCVCLCVSCVYGGRFLRDTHGREISSEFCGIPRGEHILYFQPISQVLSALLYLYIEFLSVIIRVSKLCVCVPGVPFSLSTPPYVCGRDDAYSYERAEGTNSPFSLSNTVR